MTYCLIYSCRTFRILSLIGSTRKLAHYHQHLGSHFGSY
ncbi:hypothetical protein ES288_A06G158800v1 [Gossypium darwinii]|uniref:Uncharacterized protein n=1 Tax=Gossypium darwinii TaxID=34276 RepID=A0A5D2G998_GOSDA|nr:hypothetical protein ES288_A06G158800v1 [Gossypium darwinii]